MHRRKPVWTFAAEAEGEGGNNSGETPAADGFEPITSQDELNKIVGKLRADERRKAGEKFGDYDELRTKAAELDEIKQSQRTAEEKAEESLRAAEKRAVDAEAKALRLEVAAEKGLTTAQAKRLVGSTRDELEADADELLETFKAPEPEKPTVDLDLGARTNDTTPRDPKAADLAQIEADLKAHRR